LVEKTTSDKVTRQKFFYGYIIVIAGFAVWFFGFGANSFGVFFKPLVDEFGWSRADTSLASSLNMIVAAAVTIGTGWLTDRFGPRLVVSLLGPLIGVCFLIMPHITTLWQFYLNYSLLGSFGSAVLIVPLMITVSHWFIKRRGLMIGLVQAGSIGGSLFAPFNAWLIINYGWRTAYTVLGIIVFLGLLVSGLFLLRDPGDIGQWPDNSTQNSPSASRKPKVTGLSLMQAIRTSQYWVITLLFFSFGFCRDAFFVHTAPHVQDLGFSLTDAGNIMSCLIAFSLIGRIGMGHLSDTIGNKRALLMSEVTTTIALILGLLMQDLWGLYLYAAAFGFGWGAQAVNRFSISAEAFGLASAGLLLGSMQAAESIAGAFGTYIAGYTYDITGNYRLVFILGIVISLFSLVVAPALQRIENQKRAGQSQINS
jgi:MFS family permease